MMLRKSLAVDAGSELFFDAGGCCCDFDCRTVYIEYRYDNSIYTFEKENSKGEHTVATNIFFLYVLEEEASTPHDQSKGFT